MLFKLSQHAGQPRDRKQLSSREAGFRETVRKYQEPEGAYLALASMQTEETEKKVSLSQSGFRKAGPAESPEGL